MNWLFGLVAWLRGRSWARFPEQPLQDCGWDECWQLLPRGPVRHRPREPGIVGSSPTRIILFFHAVTAEKSHVPLCCKPTSPSRRAPKVFSPGKKNLASKGASDFHSVLGLVAWLCERPWAQFPEQPSCKIVDAMNAGTPCQEVLWPGDCRVESYQDHIILSFCDSRAIPCPTVF